MLTPEQIASNDIKRLKSYQAARRMRGMSPHVPRKTPPKLGAMSKLGIVGGIGYVGLAFVQTAADKLNKSWAETNKSIAAGIKTHNKWLKMQQENRKK